MFDPLLGRAVTPPAGLSTDDPWRVPLRVALTCLVATVIGAATFLTLASRPGPAPAGASAVGDPVTLSPIPTLASIDPAAAPPDASSPPTATPSEPTPSGAAASGTTPSAPTPSALRTTTAPAAEPRPPAARHRSPAGTPAPAAPPAPTRSLRIGDRISLAERDRPTFRVRHRNFLGRVDPIGPTSAALAHADSTFTVRTGASAGCVAFESVNFPGYFLRHRNFAIRLDQADGSTLFRLDSTFCPVPVTSGAIVLRSINFPSQFVTESNSMLALSEVSSGSATAFLVKTPF